VTHGQKELDYEHWQKTSNSDHRGKTLKPSARSLLKAIKGARKVTNHTLRDRIPRWWAHVNILTQLTIKKDVLHIKLRDGPLPNKSYNKKSVNSSHMSNRGKSLSIITILLLLKTTSNETSLITLKRTIRPNLNRMKNSTRSHVGDMAQDPTCQSAQEQQSP
jgi:hypothetical protein